MTAWFAAKRPSSGDTRSTDELAAEWRTADSGGNGSYGSNGGYGSYGGGGYGREAAPMPEQGEWTRSGLPRRVPGAAARPGSDTPGSGLAAAAVGTGTPAAGMPVLGAPPFRDAPYQETRHQDVPRQEQEQSRRRSPEAARSRLSGFQLGNRDAVQAGRGPGGTPHAGEENGR
jgi:hypothetical protein